MSETNDTPDIPDELHEQRIKRLEERLRLLEKMLEDIRRQLKLVEHGAKEVKWEGGANTLGSMARRLGDWNGRNDAT